MSAIDLFNCSQIGQKIKLEKCLVCQMAYLSVTLCPNPGPFSNGVRQNQRNSFECGAILTHSCDSGFIVQVREPFYIVHIVILIHCFMEYIHNVVNS